ncbi:MAG: glycerol-3-phosphate 1-O-acyltransferase PlsY [Dehalococcoidia bacterium]
MWAIPLAAVVGYLIGSIPVGLIVGRVTRGIDVRDYGSGVTGATNVMRTSGMKAGVVVIVADIAKGIVPVYLGQGLARLADIGTTDDRAWVAAAAGFAAVCGHIWPVFANFRGGRAVASGYGAALAMNPLAALAMIPVAALVVGATRIMSVMSISMAPALAVVFIALATIDVSPWAYAAYATGAAALIVYKHRPNIERLLAGAEPKIGRGGDKRAHPVEEERAPSPS